jgi:hypothetical protein
VLLFDKYAYFGDSLNIGACVGYARFAKRVRAKTVDIRNTDSTLFQGTVTVADVYNTVSGTKVKWATGSSLEADAGDTLDITYNGLPVVGSISPSNGSTSGGTVITLTGWQEIFAPCSLSFDTAKTWRVITVIDSTSGTVVSPAGTGTRSIMVKLSNGLIVTKAAAFKMNMQPVGRKTSVIYGH